MFPLSQIIIIFLNTDQNLVQTYHECGRTYPHQTSHCVFAELIENMKVLTCLCHNLLCVAMNSLPLFPSSLPSLDKCIVVLSGYMYFVGDHLVVNS